jgi:hypothetical protein
MNVLTKIDKVTKEGLGKVEKGLSKLSKHKLKRIKFKKGKQATVVVAQNVYTKDKDRFFDNEYKEERRQLFFS